MKEQFVEIKFGSKRLDMIDLLNGIVEEYRSKKLILSVRQLYYQMVSRGHIENTVKSYKNLAALVSDARLAGLVDWSMIQDRGRGTKFNQHWRDPGQIVAAAAHGYRVNHWLGQPYHVEVMCEKDALTGVLRPVCEDLDVGLSANKGYSSSSTMYDVGKRLAAKYAGVQGWGEAKDDDKEIVILYLGDHDPSGIDMTRDVTERLTMFSGINFETKRLALNMDQVTKWNPPPNPAKETDARFKSYMIQFGKTSWELDAIEPVTLANLVRDAILSFRDEDIYQDVIKREEAERQKLLEFAATFEEPDDSEEDDSDDE